MLKVALNTQKNAYTPWAAKEEMREGGLLKERTVEAAAIALGYTSDMIVCSLDEARSIMDVSMPDVAHSSNQVGSSPVQNVAPSSTVQGLAASSSQTMPRVGRDPVLPPVPGFVPTSHGSPPAPSLMATPKTPCAPSGTDAKSYGYAAEH